MVAKQYTFGKKDRLKSRKIIEQLFTNGNRINVAPFRVLFSIEPATQSVEFVLQAGVSVSSRQFKRAVDRNRIKRQMREAFRLQKIRLQQRLKEREKILYVFFVYTGKTMPEYELVYSKLGLILNKLEKTLDEKDITNS